MVLELTVVTTNKGRALKALMKANHCTATVFIGDDVTDENAFGVLVDGDVGIKVGSGRTAADVRIADRARVADVLLRAGRQPAAGAEAPVAACRRHVRAGGEGADFRAAFCNSRAGWPRSGAGWPRSGAGWLRSGWLVARRSGRGGTMS